MLRHMILTLIGSILLMAAFEVVKQLAFPAIALWQSHAITIAFGALLATASAYVVSRRHQLLHQHTCKEISDRTRSEIARIGGDESALLLPQTDSSTAVAILERLRHTLAEHNGSCQGKPLSLSMGTATAYEYGCLTQTITAADQQMYRDKHEHRYHLAQPGQRLMD